MTPEQIQAALERLLLGVQKPARYVGGELNQVVKDWSATPVRVALVFPDIYDVGLPNLGLAILYDLVNAQPRMLAERVYAPWIDMEALMRSAGIPLYGLETKHPLADFDVVGLSLPYETLYSNALNLLDLAGLPLRSADRHPGHPLVVAGGHAAFNPEPMAEFVDAFVIGDGEEAVLEVLGCVGEWKDSDARPHRRSRAELLRALAGIEGVYVPSLYRPVYAAPAGGPGAATIGPLAALEPLVAGAPLPVRKRIVAELPPPPVRFVVPHLEVVHDRAVVEIMRGCTRGCRFCQAGMVTRPVRERSPEQVVAAVEAALDATGFSEFGLLSLSSSDYGRVLELVTSVSQRFGDRRLNISLPSLRIESFSVELMDAMARKARRGGFTLAPETVSPRLQAAINKPVEAAVVEQTARSVYDHGWHTIKLYFMIGLPGETDADVEAIADQVHQVAATGRQAIGGRARVHVGLSTFVPKPHTPLQWAALAPREVIEQRQALLRNRLRSRAIKLSWNRPEETQLEACLSRGDRRLGRVIEAAWRAGTRFDAWQEQLRFDLWTKAFDACGLDPAFFGERPRPLDEILPWDHIRALDKRLLLEEQQRSTEGRLRADCRSGRCYACGILPDYRALRAAHPGPVWRCPDVAPQEAVDGSHSSASDGEHAGTIAGDGAGQRGERG